MKQFGLIIAIILLPFFPAEAGTLVFGNGDRLQGRIERVESRILVFASEMLGRVQIPLEKVETFRGDESVVIILQQGGVEKGRASIVSEGGWELEQEGERNLLTPEEVSSVYSEEIYAYIGFRP